MAEAAEINRLMSLWAVANGQLDECEAQAFDAGSAKVQRLTAIKADLEMQMEFRGQLRTARKQLAALVNDMWTDHRAHKAQKAAAQPAPGVDEAGADEAGDAGAAAAAAAAAAGSYDAADVAAEAAKQEARERGMELRHLIEKRYLPFLWKQVALRAELERELGVKPDPAADPAAGLGDAPDAPEAPGVAAPPGDSAATAAAAREKVLKLTASAEITQGETCGGQGGLGLAGTFDEEGSAASFQEALHEWRAAGRAAEAAAVPEDPGLLEQELDGARAELAQARAKLGDFKAAAAGGAAIDASVSAVADQDLADVKAYLVAVKHDLALCTSEDAERRAELEATAAEIEFELAEEARQRELWNQEYLLHQRTVLEDTIRLGEEAVAELEARLRTARAEAKARAPFVPFVPDPNADTSCLSALAGSMLDELTGDSGGGGGSSLLSMMMPAGEPASAPAEYCAVASATAGDWGGAARASAAGTGGTETGEFNEEASAQSFQDALQSWRSSHPAPAAEPGPTTAVAAAEVGAAEPNARVGAAEADATAAGAMGASEAAGAAKAAGAADAAAETAAEAVAETCGGAKTTSGAGSGGGMFDKPGSAQSFQDALKEWRASMK